MIQENTGKFKTIGRHRIEVCPDEISGEWHDIGVQPDNFQQACAFIENELPKHTQSRVIFQTVTILKVYYSPPSYLG